MTNQSDLVRQAIEQCNRRLESVLRERNPDAVSALYTETAQLLPPAAEPVEGHAGIREFWANALSLGIREISIFTLELDVQGATAIEIGQYTLFAEDKIQLDRGKYIVIWKLMKGEWKLHRDIWNSSLPPRK